VNPCRRLVQKAAGVFEALKRDTEAHPQSADDLRGEALTMFTTLMFAQTQVPTRVVRRARSLCDVLGGDRRSVSSSKQCWPT
jgi:hypothetical protein